jgi:hypothetical protein
MLECDGWSFDYCSGELSRWINKEAWQASLWLCEHHTQVWKELEYEEERVD